MKLAIAARLITLASGAAAVAPLAELCAGDIPGAAITPAPVEPAEMPFLVLICHLQT
jgi:hypothetical protein